MPVNKLMDKLMKNDDSNTVKKIINVLSSGMPITARPFEVIAGAADCGKDENRVIKIINDLIDEKKIRRVCAVLRQKHLGYDANAMCVFDVECDLIDSTGEFAAAMPQVSHCYKRPRGEGWPYNLYAMIHAKNRSECEMAAAEIASRPGVRSYKILYSVKELKKTNMIYFSKK